MAYWRVPFTVLLGLLLLAVARCSSILQDDLSNAAEALEQTSEGLDAVQRRSILQAVTVTVGTSARATYKVAPGADAHPAFKAACDKLRSTGGVIKIEVGTYILSTQWNLDCNNTRVKGSGMNKTYLKLKDMAAKYNKEGFIRFSYLKNMEFSDFTIDGNRDKQPLSTDGKSVMDPRAVHYGRYCFYADGFVNLRILRVRGQNCQGYGFQPHGIRFNPIVYSMNVTISHCEALNNGFDGFILDQVIDGKVTNCFAKNNGRMGFNAVAGAKNIVFSNNRADGNGFGKGPEKSGNGCGFTVNDNLDMNATNIQVVNNVATNSNVGGVCVMGGVNITVSGNTLSKAQNCVHLSKPHGKRIVLSKNKCSGSSVKGLYVADDVVKSEVQTDMT